MKMSTNVSEELAQKKLFVEESLFYLECKTGIVPYKE